MALGERPPVYNPGTLPTRLSGSFGMAPAHEHTYADVSTASLWASLSGIPLSIPATNAPVNESPAPTVSNIIDKDRWVGLKSIVKIESRIKDVKTGGIHKETRYYLSSLETDAQYINHSIRAHWSVENQLHWTLDVAFGDDASRKRKDNAAQNFSLLNRIGLNIIKNAKVSSMGVKGHRKKAGWDNDYLIYALKSFDIVKI